MSQYGEPSAPAHPDAAQGGYTAPQAYPPQGGNSAPQGYPQQAGYTQQGAQGGYTAPQAYPQQGYGAPQAYPPQGAQSAPQAYPPQGAQSAPQAYPPQGAQQGGYTAPKTHHVAEPYAQKDWYRGVFACCEDTGMCCDVCFCYPCARGRIYSAAKLRKRDTLNWPICCLYFLTFGFGWAGSILRGFCSWDMRSRTREQYNIYGDCVEDVLLAVCCEGCAACQEHAQLAREGVDPGHTCCSASTKFVTPAPVQPGYQGSHM